VAFNNTDDVPHTKPPVVEPGVEFDLRFCQHTQRRLLVLHENVPGGLESAVSNAPLPRLQCRRILADNQLAVHRPDMKPTVMHNQAGDWKKESEGKTNTQKTNMKPKIDQTPKNVMSPLR
jgi:hypothetical protein